MPSSRQRKRCWHRGYGTLCPITNQCLACSEIDLNGLDQPLFDLASTLPMSCFPNDNVHPSARYGEPETMQYRVRQNTHYGTRCCLDVASIASHIHDPYSGSRRAKNVDVCNLLPPFSASTIFWNWESRWSSNEPATLNGPAGRTDLVPRYGGSSYFAPQTHSRSTPCKTGGFADGLDIMAENQTEFDCNDLESFDLCSVMHGEDIQFLENHMPWSSVAPGPFSGLSAGNSHEAAAYQPTSAAAAPMPATSDLLPQHSVLPLSADRLTPEYSPNHIEKEVDSFLDGLAEVINWDNADLDLEHSAANDMHATNSPPPIDEVADQLRDTHHNQTAEPYQQTSYPSPDAWDHELLADTAEFSSTWDDSLLNDHNHFPRSPSSLEL